MPTSQESLSVLDRARSLKKEGRIPDALQLYAELLRIEPTFELLEETAEAALRVDAQLAIKLATKARETEPTSPRAAQVLGAALARTGRPEDAETLLQSSVELDKRRSATTSPGASAAFPCPGCGEPGGKLVHISDLRLQYPDVQFTSPIRRWVRCESCRLVRRSEIAPTPELAREQLGTGLYRQPNNVELHMELLEAERTLERIEAIHPGQGRLLEIGSGHGTFLAAAQFRDYHAEGMEPFSEPREWGVERLGVQAHHGFAPGDLPDGPFDVIALWEVIEHLPDPYTVLDQLAERLAPDGVIALSTPMLDHPIHHCLGYDDPMWAELDHKVYFDQGTLEVGLVKSGLQNVDQWFSRRHLGSVMMIAEATGK